MKCLRMGILVIPRIKIVEPCVLPNKKPARQGCRLKFMLEFFCVLRFVSVLFEVLGRRQSVKNIKSVVKTITECTISHTQSYITPTYHIEHTAFLRKNILKK